MWCFMLYCWYWWKFNNNKKNIIDGLSALGIKLDEVANNVRGEEKLISAKDSSVPCYIIPTNEEVMIARDTYNLTEKENA